MRILGKQRMKQIEGCTGDDQIYKMRKKEC